MSMRWMIEEVFWIAVDCSNRSIPDFRGKGGGTPRNNIFFNFLVMNLFNKFSMLKKPYLSYIFKLVAGDNCVFI